MKSRLALIACLLLVVGCDLIVPASNPAPSPVVGTTLEAVAEQTGRDYLSGMADLCNSTAADIDAGKYKAQSQVADAFKASSENLRTSLFNVKLGQRMDQDVPPGKDLSAGDTSKAYRAMANGFKKASGK
jgi:hypothetical protein